MRLKQLMAGAVIAGAFGAAALGVGAGAASAAPGPPPGGDGGHGAPPAASHAAP
ncbi:chitin-binding protein, partial [Mycobacterium cookii]|nr:chitin-binding protein [Mycobacterium cookii]